VVAALSRGALRWRRLPAPKRAVWGGFQAARVLTPPPELPDREGVFLCRVPPFSLCLHTRHDNIPELPRLSRFRNLLDSPPAKTLVSVL
jgi:hypothetical protein